MSKELTKSCFIGVKRADGTCARIAVYSEHEFWFAGKRRLVGSVVCTNRLSMCLARQTGPVEERKAIRRSIIEQLDRSSLCRYWYVEAEGSKNA